MTLTEVQTPAPLAVIHGEPLLEFPRDLYIPPDALELVRVGVFSLCFIAIKHLHSNCN